MTRSPALNTPTPDRGRVLIVDDSAVARAVIGQFVATDGRFVVAQMVATAAAALDFLARETVDFILLDVNMPGVDGITALPDLIAAGRGAKVLVVSSAASDGAATTVQALALGAADTLVKPVGGASGTRFGGALIDKLARLADGASPSGGEASGTVTRAPVPPVPGAVGDEYDIIAIGASTGGIHALSALLREVPPTCRLPIVVTQHLPSSFMPYFAAQLSVLAGRPCDVAVDRLRIRPGRLVVAPGDAHLRCVALPDGGAAIRLSRESSISGCTPSVDPMLSSLAKIYGRRMLAVVLSGMGRDGAEGAREVHEAGGCVVVQDQASSVIWGMPGAVAATGCVDAMLPPAAIGRLAATRQRP